MIAMQCALLLYLLCLLPPALSDVTTPHKCLPSPSQKCFTAILGQQLNWNDAEKYCENNLPNGRLASIHNAFENNILYNWLPLETSNPWIGAFQNGSGPFQWVDGSPFDYTNWVPGEPYDSCVQVCKRSVGFHCYQGAWITEHCEPDLAPFICEYENVSNSPDAIKFH